jgi:hypothetical protein
MDPTPYLRLSTARPPSIPPTGFVDLYYDATLGRMATLGADGQINSPDVPIAVPAQWGFIIGDINAQTDLMAQLNGKLAKTGGTVTGNLTVSLVLQTQGLLVSDTVNFAATTWAYNGGPTGAAAVAHRAALGIVAADPGVTIRSHGDTDDTIVLEDRYVRTTSSTDVIQRIPNDAVVDFPIGTKITFRQAGQGDISLEPGAGVSLYGQVTTAGRNRSLGIIKVGPNEWDTERGAF